MCYNFQNFFKYLKKKHKAEDINCAPMNSLSKHVFLDNFCKTFEGKTESVDDILVSLLILIVEIVYSMLWQYFYRCIYLI